MNPVQRHGRSGTVLKFEVCCTIVQTEKKLIFRLYKIFVQWGWSAAALGASNRTLDKTAGRQSIDRRHNDDTPTLAVVELCLQSQWDVLSTQFGFIYGY